MSWEKQIRLENPFICVEGRQLWLRRRGSLMRRKSGKRERAWKVHDWPQWQDGEWLLCMAPGLRGRTAALERLLCRKAHGSSGCRLPPGGSTPPWPWWPSPAAPQVSCTGQGEQGAFRYHLSCCQPTLLLVVNYFLSLLPVSPFCHLVLCCFFVSLIFCFLDEVEAHAWPVSFWLGWSKYRAWVVVCPGA